MNLAQKLTNGYVQGQKYASFTELRDRLISEGKTFDRETVAQLRVREMCLAFVTNAEKARCDEYSILEEELEKRFALYDDCPIEQLASVAEDKDMHKNLFYRRAEREQLMQDWNTAPAWLQLHHALKTLQDMAGHYKVENHRSEDTPESKCFFDEFLPPLVEAAKHDHLLPARWLEAAMVNCHDEKISLKNNFYITHPEMNVPERVGNLEYGLEHSRARIMEERFGYQGVLDELFYRVLTPAQQLTVATPVYNEPLLIDYEIPLTDFQKQAENRKREKITGAWSATPTYLKERAKERVRSIIT